MNGKSNTLVKMAVCFLMAATAGIQAADKKTDPTGTWIWSSPGREGQTRESTLKLKLEGEKLTGTLMGRNNETAIENGKIKGDEVSFTVTREFNGNKFTMNYAGKITNDSLKGKIEFERNGEKQTRDWEAKRKVEKKDGN